MNEGTLIKKAKTELTKEGGMAWSGSTWTDIFGIFDIVYLDPRGRTSFYQVSTVDHHWARRLKIDNYLRKNITPLPPRAYLMLWDYKANQFVYELL